MGAGLHQLERLVGREDAKHDQFGVVRQPGHQHRDVVDRVGGAVEIDDDAIGGLVGMQPGQRHVDAADLEGEGNVALARGRHKRVARLFVGDDADHRSRWCPATGRLAVVGGQPRHHCPPDSEPEGEPVSSLISGVTLPVR